MIKKRSLVLVAVFTIITLGIYSIFWLYATRKEIVAINREPKSIPRMLILFIPVIVFGVLLALAILTSLFESLSGASQVFTIATFIASIPTFFAILIVSIWWFYHYSKAVANLTQESREYYFVIWVVCFLFGVTLVWTLIVQYQLNKLAAQPASAGRTNNLSPEPPVPEQTK